jgi:hypothetical protein
MLRTHSLVPEQRLWKARNEPQLKEGISLPRCLPSSYARDARWSELGKSQLTAHSRKASVSLVVSHRPLAVGITASRTALSVVADGSHCRSSANVCILVVVFHKFTQRSCAHLLPLQSCKLLVKTTLRVPLILSTCPPGTKLNFP